MKADIPAYSFIQSEITYNCRGDEGWGQPLSDTLSITPVLQWDTIPAELLVAAIFSSPIQVENATITNISDLVYKRQILLDFLRQLD